MTVGRNSALFLAATVLLTLAPERSDAQILSSKRGFADTGANYTNLQATGAGWYYTWGTGTGSPANFDAKHYPMFWNAPGQSTITNVRNRNPEWVLGFNEPERTDQANMSVSSAISSWTNIVNGLNGTTIKVASPAVSDTGAGQAWIASFMSQAAANNLRVDAVAFHWYGVSTPSNPAGAASSFLSRVDSYHNQFNKPVFITEFAIHDWGGNYSDAEIIEANRQFLDIVIPGLESRSYVAGYAWYHWFSDARLYDSNPAKPTPMAYSYVGALTSGKSEDIGGRDLGQHVAYLAGGQLTMTGATPGTIRYINALENVSTIAGTLDWSLASTNWVRVQPGATLRKTGANQITFSGGTITNNGALEVSQGRLQIGANVTGNGNATVRGGTLALIGAGRLSNAPLVDVRSGGTLDVAGMNANYIVGSARTLKFDAGATVTGNVNANAGSLVAGAGVLNGNLAALSGSHIRVGNDGSGVASRILIDNFESYATGDVRDVASPPWTAHQNTSLVDIETVGSKVLSYGWASDFRGASRGLPEVAVISSGEKATIFFRFNSKTDDPDHNFGVGDQANTGAVNFGDFEAQIRLKQGTAANTFDLDARNGGAFTATLVSGLALNTWHNAWMVVDRVNESYDVYTSTGSAPAVKRTQSALSFRNGSNPGDLNALLALAGASNVDNGVRIDDVVYMTGEDLTNPSAAFDPGLSWVGATLTINGDFTQAVGSTLELNIRDPANHDVLAVSGAATLNGLLSVSLAIGAASPQLGDEFDILDLDVASTVIGTMQLPELSAGLAWDQAHLRTTGALRVITTPAGSFDQYSDVDGRDFLIWQMGGSPNPGSEADLNAWRQGYTAAAQLAAAVPEPATLPLLAALAPLIARRRAWA